MLNTGQGVSSGIHWKRLSNNGAETGTNCLDMKDKKYLLAVSLYHTFKILSSTSQASVADVGFPRWPETSRHT